MKFNNREELIKAADEELMHVAIIPAGRPIGLVNNKEYAEYIENLRTIEESISSWLKNRPAKYEELDLNIKDNRSNFSDMSNASKYIWPSTISKQTGIPEEKLTEHIFPSNDNELVILVNILQNIVSELNKWIQTLENGRELPSKEASETLKNILESIRTLDHVEKEEIYKQLSI